MTSMKIARISYIIRVPMTSWAYFSFLMPISSKLFWITAVELIESIQPRKIQLKVDNPNR